MFDAPANGQHSPHAFIADDARQRRSDRICTLDEVHVVHVDRCMLDTDQRLVGARCRRFRKVGKLERREVRPARPVSWVLRFTPDRSYTLRFDGARWSRQRGEAQADLVIQTSPEGWVRFLSADRAGRERWLDRSCVAGTSKSAKEFASAFDRPIDE